MGIIDLELPQRWHPWLRREICVLSGGKHETPRGGGGGGGGGERERERELPSYFLKVQRRGPRKEKRKHCWPHAPA